MATRTLMTIAAVAPGVRPLRWNDAVVADSEAGWETGVGAVVTVWVMAAPDRVTTRVLTMGDPV